MWQICTSDTFSQIFFCFCFLTESFGICLSFAPFLFQFVCSPHVASDRLGSVCCFRRGRTEGRAPAGPGHAEPESPAARAPRGPRSRSTGAENSGPGGQRPRPRGPLPAQRRSGRRVGQRQEPGGPGLRPGSPARSPRACRAAPL